MRWYKRKPERKLDLPGLRVVELVNDRIVTTLSYWRYGLLKKLYHYDNEFAQQLHYRVKRIRVQKQHRTISGKNPMSVSAFVEGCKSACDGCGLHEVAEMWRFEDFFTGPAEPAVKMRGRLTSSANFSDQGALKSYSATVQFIFNRNVKDKIIAKLDEDVPNIRQETIALTWYGQELWTKTLSCG